MRLPRQPQQRRAPSPGERFERLTGLRLGDPAKLWSGEWDLAWDNDDPAQAVPPVYMVRGGGKDLSLRLQPGEGPAPDCDPTIAHALQMLSLNTSRKATPADYKEIVRAELLRLRKTPAEAEQDAKRAAEWLKRREDVSETVPDRKRVLRDAPARLARVVEELDRIGGDLASVLRFSDAEDAVRKQTGIGDLREWLDNLHSIARAVEEAAKHDTARALPKAAATKWRSPPRRVRDDRGSVPQAEALRWFASYLRDGPFAPKTRRGRPLSPSDLAELLLWSGLYGEDDPDALDGQLKRAIRGR